MVKKCIVSGCMIFNKSRLLLIEHKKLGMWLQPGGHIDENETPMEAAIREVKEETGLDVVIVGSNGIDPKLKNRLLVLPLVISWERVLYKDKPMHYHYDLIYLAKLKKPRQKPKINDESKSVGWFRESEIDRLKMPEATRMFFHKGFRDIKKY